MPRTKQTGSYQKPHWWSEPSTEEEWGIRFRESEGMPPDVKKDLERRYWQWRYPIKPANAAVHYDDGKLDWSLLPIDATEAELRVWQFGAVKYAPHNWRRGMKLSRILGSAFRHLAAIQRGEDIDPESGQPHAAHVRCNMAMLIHQLNQPEWDDRWKAEVSE